MNTRIFYRILQLRQRLWAKPLIYCALAVAASLLAQRADYWSFADVLPKITAETIETLLTIISSSMLAVATFAVGSMLASYNSASRSATPRAFTLVLADDVSQTALSSYIGAFIFSIVSLVALKTELYGRGGLFVLFVLTLLIFAWVVLTFVRWVDNIARLGRVGPTIDKAERAALKSLSAYRLKPYLGGIARDEDNRLSGAAVHCIDIGYVQLVDMENLQRIAEERDLRIMVEALPGAFLAPGQPVVVLDQNIRVDDDLRAEIEECFVIGDNRTFENDPRFGMIVLAEIAARALSPAVNDPGTAIVIIGRFVRLFSAWADPIPEDEKTLEDFDRVIVPGLKISELFDDAFTSIARDGAGMVEVGIRLQKAFASLARLNYPGFAEESQRHSELALKRARGALSLEEDLARIERLAITQG